MYITTIFSRDDDRFFTGSSGDELPADDNATETQLPGRAKEVIACAVVMVACAAIVVGLRIYCRAFLVRRVGKDDWAILVALILSVGNSTGMSIQAVTALGKHMTVLTAEEVILFFKEAYATMILYNASLAWAKISILLLYLRLFGVAHPTLRKTTYALIVFVALSGLWLVCCVAFFCWPIEASWDVSIESKCLPRKMRWYLGPSLNIATDLMIISLPLRVISKMRLQRPQKIGVSLAFAAGFFVCIVSFIRLKYVIEAEHSTDPSYDNPAIANWSIVELNMAIMCPCIVTLRPLTSRIHWGRRAMLSSPLESSEETGNGPRFTVGTVETTRSRSSWFPTWSSSRQTGANTTTSKTSTSSPTEIGKA